LFFDRETPVDSGRFYKYVVREGMSAADGIGFIQACPFGPKQGRRDFYGRSR
jgi:hypothetical protein